jgi:hypothetical protein
MLLSDLPTCGLGAVSDGISIRFDQRPDELFCCQFPDRDGLRPCPNGMDTRTPERLVGGK